MALTFDERKPHELTFSSKGHLFTQEHKGKEHYFDMDGDEVNPTTMVKIKVTEEETKKSPKKGG